MDCIWPQTQPAATGDEGIFEIILCRLALNYKKRIRNGMERLLMIIPVNCYYFVLNGVTVVFCTLSHRWGLCCFFDLPGIRK